MIAKKIRNIKSRRSVKLIRKARKLSKRSPFNKKVTSIVKQVLSKQVEVKRVVYPITMLPSVLQSATTSLAGNYIIASPASGGLSNGYTVTLGTQNNQRMGNEIRVKKLLFEYILYPNVYNPTTNTQMTPCEVIVYFFKSKSGPSTVLAPTFDLPQLYDGGSSAIGPNGSIIDVMRKLNKEAYTYLTHRRHKVGKSTIGSVSNLQAPNYNALTNNDFKANIVAKIDLTKHCAKTIVFPDNSSGATNTAITPWIHCLVQTVAADGSLLNTTQLPLTMIGQIVFDYTDM